MKTVKEIAKIAGKTVGILFALVIVVVLIMAAIDVVPQMIDGHRYRQEIKHFDKVVNEASDEELFLMLRVAIYHQFVPLHEIDPYFDMHYNTSPWFKIGRIYRRLSGRHDLLEQIYPNIDRLDEYVLSQHSGIWRDDVCAMRDTIIQNLASDSLLLDSIYNQWFDKEGLMGKYFCY